MDLTRELAASARSAFAIYRERCSHETAYAFGLYVVSEDGLIVGSAYATNEATARRAAEYAFMLDGDDATRARIIRWWDADWPYVNDQRSLFDAVNAKIRATPVTRDAYINALATLDRSLFGDVVLGVFGGDRSDVDRSVARLNPPELLARYRAEVAAAEREYSSLTG